MIDPVTGSHVGFWAATGMITAIILASSTGELLTAAAMKSIGDLDEIRARAAQKAGEAVVEAVGGGKD